jgi:GMP synthase (glutamine-hydrolysing)
MPVFVVDNLSPFTPEILECLGRLGISYVYKKFSEVSDFDLARCEKVILSGRRKNSREINAVNSKIVRQCHGGGKPLLGICYGAEIIALTLGGSIRKMPAHVHGTTPVSVSGQNPLTEGKKSISVYESHGYCVARLPASFRSLASSHYCDHEIFSSGKTYGTQFHPEKSGSDGLALLQNFAAKL